MYFLIGISLLFACLYAINFSASVLASAVWRMLATSASRWQALTRSNLIFILRSLPLATAIVFIFAFILPAYLLFEPASPGESVGYKLAVIVGISAFGLAAALCRMFASWWRTRRLIADWMNGSEPVTVSGISFPAYRLRHAFPVIAVVGVIRPRIFVAEQVFAELDEAELTAAIAHEAGHISSRDNFKRIAMRICGDLLVLPLWKTLDRMWLESAESAADEYAADRGGRAFALNLASALVKIGRITPEKEVWDMPMAAYLIDPDDASLATRVEGLLQIADQAKPGGDSSNCLSTALWLIPALALAVVAILPLAANNNLLFTIHSMSESLLAALQ